MYGDVDNNLKNVLQTLSVNDSKFDDIVSLICQTYSKETFSKIGRIEFVLPKIGAEEIKYLEISLRANKSHAGERIEILVLDITQLIQGEQDKLKIKYKGLTLAKFAHELKNPINIINLITQEMKNENKVKFHTNIDDFMSSELSLNRNFNYDLDNKNIEEVTDKKHKLKEHTSILMDESTKNMKFISSLCDFLLILVADLNTFVKSDNSDENLNNIELKEVNIWNILEFCHSIYHTKQKFDQSKQNLKVLMEIDSDVPKLIMSDETKLKQVLINLTSNAYKFTPAGEILISAKRFTGEKGDDFVRLMVKDSGEILSLEEQQNLFKLFSQIKRHQDLNRNGSGLGLLIVKDTVTKLGSQLFINSQIGKGSSFYFDIKLPQRLSCDSLSKTVRIDQCLFPDKYFKEIPKLTNSRKGKKIY